MHVHKLSSITFVDMRETSKEDKCYVPIVSWKRVTILMRMYTSRTKWCHTRIWKRKERWLHGFRYFHTQYNNNMYHEHLFFWRWYYPFFISKKKHGPCRFRICWYTFLFRSMFVYMIYMYILFIHIYVYTYVHQHIQCAI